MSKFKIGDKVQVVSLQETYRGDCNIPVGCVGTVVSHCVGGGYLNYVVEFQDNEGVCKSWSWNESNLELVKKCVKVETVSKDNVNGIPSDGGSSDYYFTKLPQHLINQIVETGGIEIKDIIRYVFDNSADAFNIVKAQKRIVEASKGKGKSGITALYDANKIKFFANEQYEAIKQGEVE